MKILLSSILVIFLMLINQAFSEQKIAFIDMDKVISTSKSGSSILKQLTDLNNKNSKFLKDQKKKFQEKESSVVLLFWLLVGFLGRFCARIRTQRAQLYRIHPWKPQNSVRIVENHQDLTSIKLTSIKV